MIHNGISFSTRWTSAIPCGRQYKLVMICSKLRTNNYTQRIKLVGLSVGRGELPVLITSSSAANRWIVYRFREQASLWLTIRMRRLMFVVDITTKRF